MRSAALLLVLIGCSSRSELSPLVNAVRSGDVAEVRALVARGSDPDAPSGGNGWTPLMHAVHKNQLAAAAALLDAGAAPDRAKPSGFTPLMMAAAYDNKEMTALLLGRGASPRVADAEGKTALDHAIAGTFDVDRITYFRCNHGTAALLTRVSPSPRAATMRWAKMKGCA